jgi:RNA polymerase sigma factor for flagellar operon FliA
MLSENEKLVLTLYYYEELTQVEIAEIIELSAARVSQIHSQAIRRLRGMLSREKEYFF